VNPRATSDDARVEQRATSDDARVEQRATIVPALFPRPKNFPDTVPTVEGYPCNFRLF